MGQTRSSLTGRARVRLLFWAIVALFAAEILYFALV
jgi:hypothetical protein